MRRATCFEIALISIGTISLCPNVVNLDRRVPAKVFVTTKTSCTASNLPSEESGI